MDPNGVGNGGSCGNGGRRGSGKVRVCGENGFLSAIKRKNISLG